MQKVSKRYLLNDFFVKWWRSIDQPTVICLIILFAYSLILMGSASPAIASRIGVDELYFISRQTVYLCIAAIIIFIVSNFDLPIIRRLGIFGFIFSMILLVLVKFYGYDIKGAKRWINIAGFSIQPSEFVKPFFYITNGWILSTNHKSIGFSPIWISMLLYITSGVGLILQPDFGMLLLLTMTWSIQLFAYGISFRIILAIMVLCSCTSLMAYNLFPHVALRMNKFFGGEQSYQVSKSLLAFEHGGLYGKGPGEGVIKQFLPDSHTDFIFAVAAEEFGALACLLLIGLLGFITIRGFLQIPHNNEAFLTSLGLLSQFALQSIINMGVTVNLLPTKGMTLPFISYGGSSSISLAIGMGVMLCLTKQKFKRVLV